MAHRAGRLEEAIDLARRASIQFDAPERQEAERLLLQYLTESGRKREPQVVRLIVAAKDAAASGDRARAVSLLTQATDWSNSYAPSWVEADQLLKQLNPPPPTPAAAAVRSRFGGHEVERQAITLQDYQRVKPGMTLAEVESILGPGAEQASAEAPGLLGTNTSQVYLWQRGFRIISVLTVNDKVLSKSQVGLEP